MPNKIVGYSFWNYLSDIEPDSPGGGNFYIPDLILEMKKRDWKVIPLQENRDKLLADQRKCDIPFGDNFIPEVRKECYDYLFETKKDGSVGFVDIKGIFCEFPKLDLLILEWRWPIAGRNTQEDKGKTGFTPDLLRQMAILDHYHNNTDTTCVILDLDHKLTIDDEKKYYKCHILETSVNPLEQYTLRERAFLPFDVSRIRKNRIYLKDPNNVITYIGNNYERSEIIDEYIKPISKEFPGGVRFVGNWTKYPEIFADIKKRWPNIVYEPRVVKEDFIYKYGPSLSCPLLAKQAYYDRGFVTPRILESLLYGCLPVGFTCHRGIEYFLPKELIVSTPEEYIKLIKKLKKMTIYEYKQLINKTFPFLDIYSPKVYVDKLEGLIGTIPKRI
jgi:hypothetical protein